MTDDQLNERLDEIQKQLDVIIHGNGRKGLRQITDFLFGEKGGDPAKGAKARLEAIEVAEAKRVSDRRVQLAYQRGIAVGLALVASNTFFGLQLDLPAIARALAAWLGN